MLKFMAELDKDEMMVEAKLRTAEAQAKEDTKKMAELRKDIRTV